MRTKSGSTLKSSELLLVKFQKSLFICKLKLKKFKKQRERERRKFELDINKNQYFLFLCTINKKIINKTHLIGK